MNTTKDLQNNKEEKRPGSHRRIMPWLDPETANFVYEREYSRLVSAAYSRLYNKRLLKRSERVAAQLEAKAKVKEIIEQELEKAKSTEINPETLPDWAKDFDWTRKEYRFRLRLSLEELPDFVSKHLAYLQTLGSEPKMYSRGKGIKAFLKELLKQYEPMLDEEREIRLGEIAEQLRLMNARLSAIENGTKRATDQDA